MDVNLLGSQGTISRVTSRVEVVVLMFDRPYVWLESWHYLSACKHRHPYVRFGGKK